MRLLYENWSVVLGSRFEVSNTGWKPPCHFSSRHQHSEVCKCISEFGFTLQQISLTVVCGAHCSKIWVCLLGFSSKKYQYEQRTWTVFRPLLCMAVWWSCQAFGPSFLRINYFLFVLIWSFWFLRLFLFASFFFLHLFFDILFSDYSMEQLGQTRMDSVLVQPILTVKFH